MIAGCTPFMVPGHGHGIGNPGSSNNSIDQWGIGYYQSQIQWPIMADYDMFHSQGYISPRTWCSLKEEQGLGLLEEESALPPVNANAKFGADPAVKQENISESEAGTGDFFFHPMQQQIDQESLQHSSKGSNLRQDQSVSPPERASCSSKIHPQFMDFCAPAQIPTTSNSGSIILTPFPAANQAIENSRASDSPINPINPGSSEKSSSDFYHSEEQSGSFGDSRGSRRISLETGDLGLETGDLTSESKEQGLETGLELINLLLACMEAVSTKSLSLVNPLLAQLGELASPKGTPLQRVAAYFTEALACRAARTWPQIYQPLPVDLELFWDDEDLAAFHILNHVSPYIKFCHFTANQAILQAFQGHKRVHVIDFGIKQGLQWPALFQSLASRPEGPPQHIRITGVGEFKEDLQETGDRLAEFAANLNLEFEFHPVIDKLEDVRLWMLHVKENEAVAVNCPMQMHRVLAMAAGVRDFLDLVKSCKPKVVAMAEQEGAHNGRLFENRFLEAFQYYCAVFDSMDWSLPPESPARLKLEQFFAREIRNILVCEGPERIERHERFEIWSQILQAAGFRNLGLDLTAFNQAKLLLEMYSCKNYSVRESDGSISLVWLDRPLLTASAWAPN